MNRLTRAAFLLAITGGLLAPLSPASAGAEPAGGLLIIRGTGNDVTPIRLRTSAGCPAAANAFYATMKGHGLPPEGQIVTANTKAGMSHSMGFDAYVALVMRDYSRDSHTTLNGRYDITVFCVDRLTRRSYRDFTGSLEFVNPTHFRAAVVTERPSAQPGDGTGWQLGRLVPVFVGATLGALVLSALVSTAVARRIRSGRPS